MHIQFYPTHTHHNKQNQIKLNGIWYSQRNEASSNKNNILCYIFSKWCTLKWWLKNSIVARQTKTLFFCYYQVLCILLRVPNSSAVLFSQHCHSMWTMYSVVWTWLWHRHMIRIFRTFIKWDHYQSCGSLLTPRLLYSIWLIDPRETLHW